ncbi:MAG: MBL fold metallo-hydrolase [Bryobacteraceae bacterium]
MKLTFWGAVRTVTGSMHEVAVDGQRFLLDCGLYQGRREEAFERNSQFPFPARSIAGVVLSHAHIDHSGNLPSLARNGYEGDVHATPATVDLCDAMLKDSAFLQEKDADFVNRLERNRKKKPVEPLYRIADAERILESFRPTGYHQPKHLTNELSFEYYDAGHLLGSAAMQLTYRNNGQSVRLTFSGDVGRKGLPIIRDPETMPETDYLIMESTYGNRLHEHEGAVLDRLAAVINRTAERGGKVIVPAFAVGRTQQLVLLLHELVERKAIPSIPIYVDSPLAVNATDAYRRHSDVYDAETARFLQEGEDPLGFGMLRYIRDAAESKKLNDMRGPMVIISASGMCEAGRILHHLRNNIEDPRCTVLIVGFQAEHTLGRKIVEKRFEVPIFGVPTRLRAEVVTINELSGHADRNELLEWMKPFARGLKKVFLVHGEIAQGEPLAAAIRETYGVEAVIPNRGESFSI